MFVPVYLLLISILLGAGLWIKNTWKRVVVRWSHIIVGFLGFGLFYGYFDLLLWQRSTHFFPIFLVAAAAHVSESVVSTELRDVIKVAILGGVFAFFMCATVLLCNL